MLVRRTVAGRTFTAYAYNGQIPGPLIDVTQGATIVVQFHNATDLPSAVHWHGIRLDSASDGAAGSRSVPSRRGTFTYRVRFPDAGIYWYHSHEREDIQQPLGLYGNIIVRPASAPPPPSMPSGCWQWATCCWPIARRSRLGRPGRRTC